MRVLSCATALGPGPDYQLWKCISFPFRDLDTLA